MPSVSALSTNWRRRDEPIWMSGLRLERLRFCASASSGQQSNAQLLNRRPRSAPKQGRSNRLACIDCRCNHHWDRLARNMIGINRRVHRERMCEEAAVIVRGKDAEMLRNGGIIVSREELEALRNRVILDKTELDELRYGHIPENERTKIRTFFDRLDKFLEVRKKNQTETRPGLSGLSQMFDSGRVSDESMVRNPVDPRAVAPDAGGRAGGAPTVDQMVSSFLWELDTLSDPVPSSQAKPAEQSHDSSAPADTPEGRGAPKGASYRNIDVLLMDNARSAAARQRSQEGFSQTSHMAVRTPPGRHSPDNAFLRLSALGWTSLKSVYARCRSVFLASAHSDWLR